MITNANGTVSMPLHANQAKAPQARQHAPATTPPQRPVRRSAMRAVSTTSPACATSASAQATKRSDRPRTPRRWNGASSTGQSKLVAPVV
ncbi:MAG: hypothetical protein WKG00_10995 [Polyangiaceae bacterium]